MIYFPTVLAIINVFIGLGLMFAGIRNAVAERRKGYSWMWILTIVIGGLWFSLYMLDIMKLEFGIRSLMGTGLIRSFITATIGLLLGVVLQSNVSRKL